MYYYSASCKTLVKDLVPRWLIGCGGALLQARMHIAGTDVQIVASSLHISVCETCTLTEDGVVVLQPIFLISKAILNIGKHVSNFIFSFTL